MNSTLIYNNYYCVEVDVSCYCLFLLLYVSVSAFYAECPSKRMYISGTVGTKTKFLGLSVKAQNNGTGRYIVVQCLTTEFLYNVHVHVHI